MFSSASHSHHEPHPFVLFDVDDRELLREITFLSQKQYNQPLFKMEATPSKSAIKEAQSLPEFTFERIQSGARVFIYAHGTPTTYGPDSLTAAEFGDLLIARKLPDNIPITLDLVGCEIGMTANGDSYVHQVAQYLYEKGYKNVTIKALTSLVADQEISSLFLTHSTWEYEKNPSLIAERFWTLEGLPPGVLANAKEAVAADPVSRQRAELLEKRTKNIVKLKELHAKAASASGPEAKVLQGQIESLIHSTEILEKRSVGLSRIISRKTEELFMPHAKHILTTSDLRKTLDRRNNCIKFELYQLYKQLSKPRKEAIRILNNRMDAVNAKSEYQSAPRTSRIKFIAEIKQNKYNAQFVQLELFLKKLKNPEIKHTSLMKEMDELIQQFSAGKIKGKSISKDLCRIREELLKENLELKNTAGIFGRLGVRAEVKEQAVQTTTVQSAAAIISQKDIADTALSPSHLKPDSSSAQEIPTLEDTKKNVRR